MACDELNLLRYKLGRGPADLLVTLALMTDALKTYESGTVGPITAEHLARQVRCSKASLHRWRQKLEALGLLRVTKSARGAGGGLVYRVLTPGDPYMVFKRHIDELCEEELAEGRLESKRPGWVNVPQAWPPLATELVQ